MPTTLKKSVKSENNQQLMIDINPEAKQVDFNSKEIKEELTKLKERNQLILDLAMVDTQKLSIHFTV